MKPKRPKIDCIVTCETCGAWDVIKVWDRIARRNAQYITHDDYYGWNVRKYNRCACGRYDNPSHYNVYLTNQ